MRFTVSSWHYQPVDYWLSHNAWTTMAAPPRWAREHNRNLALFAPPPQIVFHDPPLSADAYEPQYWDALRGRWGAIKRWVRDQGDGHVILLCACPDGRFCHRLLIRKLLLEMRCVEAPLPGVEDA